MRITRLLPVPFIILLVLTVASYMVSANLILKEPVEDFTMDEDTIAYGKINLNDHFSNDQGKILFSSVGANNKIDVMIHEDGSVDLSPPKDWYGTEIITFTASDGEQEVSDTILVKVEPVNDAPSLISPLPDLPFEFNEDESLEDAFNIYSHFLDIDSILAFSYSSDNIVVEIHENGYVDFSAPKDWHGMEEVTFIASDGELEVSDSVLVNVHPINDAPRSVANFASIGLIAGQQPKTLKLNDYFTDVDNEVLTYEITGNTWVESEIDLQKEQLTLYAPEEWTGEELLTLTAKDPSGGATSVQITVIATRGAESPGQVFYLLGLVLAVAITGMRLQFTGKKRSDKSPVDLHSYRHYKGR